MAECRVHGLTLHREYPVKGKPWKAKRCLECKRARARELSKETYVPVGELTERQAALRRAAWRKAKGGES